MDGGTNDGFVPKGTLTPLGHLRTGGVRPLDCNDGGGKDAPTSTSVRQPSTRRPCLIPAWPARGIFAGDAYKTPSDDAGSRKRRRKDSANANLERLLGDEVRQCDVCARAVLWTPSMERRYVSTIGHADDDGPSEKSVAECLPWFIERHVPSASPLPCSFCASDDRSRRWCGALYCSDDCRVIGEGAVALQMPRKPEKVATEPTDEALPPPKLFFCPNRFSTEVELQEGKSEVDGLVEEATDSIAAIETRFRSICGYDGANVETDTHALGVEECALLLATILSCTCPDTISTAMQSTDNQPLQNINADEESLVEEMWAMARAHGSIYQELINWSGSGTAKAQPFPSYQAFAQCYLDIKRNCLLRVDAPTVSLAAYATKTIISKDALTEEERSSALDLLKCSWLARGDNETSGVESRDMQSILRWRRVAHYAHWASNPTTSSDLESKRVQALLRKSYFVYSPSIFRDTEHSCAPTLMLTIPDWSTGEKSSKSPLDKLSWLALHDVTKGDASISKLDSLEGDVAARSVDFARLMGKGRVCLCIRCRYDSLEADSCDVICLKDDAHSESSVGTLHFTRSEVKRLADQAMQQGRFEDASNLYSIILRAHPKDGDVLHARAASYLGRASSLPFADIGHCQGHFVESQRLWYEAGLIEECASHREIAVQVAKQRVYKTNQHVSGGETANGGLIAFTTHWDGRCFITSDPVISPEECQRAIKSTEEYATRNSGGWTTSRHYAVPTTDIPIHELTSLHPWFCNLWDATIRPLLRRQFQLDKPPQRDIFLHDAFLVRYDAERQRYLPPHVDESTHSFIIALNDGFEGGGTYFHALGKTLAPSVGGMVSFCGGEVLHSGDPVVKGVRYVIAAFCYIDLVGGGADASSEKPPNLKGMFADKGQAAGLFSFGFIDG